MKQPQLHRLSLILATAALMTQPAFAADGVVATVNGKEIPQARMDLIIESQIPEEARKEDSEEFKKIKEEVRKALIRNEALAQQAEKDGYGKDPKVIQQLDIARESILINAMIADYVKKNPISEKDLKAEYDQIVKNAAGKNKEYNARHILVKTEDEAKEVLAALKKGEKFEDLAKAKSQDPGTKDNGGELGWSTPRTFVKPFADAMVGLKKGETSPEPVKTDFGYHVIQVKDVRDATPPAFNDVKAQVEERLQQKRVADFVQGIESKAEVK